jgi:hypothetical protein
MTSYRQIEANRRNTLKSTGPRTEAGKQASRRNAVRHGLMAETVITALEDANDYQAFEAAITADYDAQSTVERELVLRLASILWRLRRATMMETGLFEIEAEHVREYRENRRLLPDSLTLFTPSFAGTIPRRTRTPPRSSSPAPSCGSPICRISQLIALAAMKPLSGVKPVASYTPSRHWTGVNHRNECGVVGFQVKVRSSTNNQLGRPHRLLAGRFTSVSHCVAMAS